jgi:hypothetical protein
MNVTKRELQNVFLYPKCIMRFREKAAILIIKYSLNLTLRGIIQQGPNTNIILCMQMMLILMLSGYASAQSLNTCCPDNIDLRVTKNGAGQPVLNWIGGISAEYFITRSTDPRFEPAQYRFLPDVSKPEKDRWTTTTLTDTNAPGPPSGSSLYFYRVQDRNSRAYEETYPFDETIISYTHQCSHDAAHLPNLVSTEFRKIATSHIRIPQDYDSSGNPMTRTLVMRALIRWYQGPPNMLCVFRFRLSPVHPGHDTGIPCATGCTINQFNIATPPYLSTTFFPPDLPDYREYAPEAFSIGEYAMAWPHYGEWDITLEGMTATGSDPVVLGAVLLHTVGIPTSDPTFPSAGWESSPGASGANASVGSFAGTWTKLIETSTFSVPANQTVNIYAQAYTQWQSPSDPNTSNEFKFQLTNVTTSTSTDMDTFSVHTPPNVTTGSFNPLRQDGRHLFNLWRGVTAGATTTQYKVSLWARNLQSATTTIGPARILAVALHDQLITAKSTRVGDHAFDQTTRQAWEGAVGPIAMVNYTWDPVCGGSYYNYFWWTELSSLTWSNPDPTLKYGTWPDGTTPRWYTHGFLHAYIKWTGGTPTTGYPTIPLQLMIAHFQHTTVTSPCEFGIITGAYPEHSVTILNPSYSVPSSSIDSINQVSDWSGIGTAYGSPPQTATITERLLADIYTCCPQGTTTETYGVTPTPLARPSTTIFELMVFPEETQLYPRITTATQCHIP